MAGGGKGRVTDLWFLSLLIAKGFLFSRYIWVPGDRLISNLPGRLTEVKILNPFGGLRILLNTDDNDLTQS